MRKFIFIEYNEPGMEWISPKESPILTIVEAPSPEEALEKWIEGDARYWTEECAEAQAEGHDSVESVLETAWGVDLKMFEITADYSATPKAWLKTLLHGLLLK